MPLEPLEQTQMGKKDTTSDITAALLTHVAGIAKLSNASIIFVYVDALEGERLSLPEEIQDKIIYVTRTIREDLVQKDMGTRYIRVPNVLLPRMSQVKIATILALSRGLIRAGDTIVFLSGLASTGTLDTLIVTQVGREQEMYCPLHDHQHLIPGIDPGVLQRTVEIAVELGTEGREGKPVGAIFIIGDTDRVQTMTRQLVINPFYGYARDQRTILKDDLLETIKEFSSIDGAFIIDGEGIIESCGTYLKTAGQKEFELPRGLGARHHAAAGITSMADCIAITVSESTGTTTVFRGGHIVTEIERQRLIGAKTLL
jgi:diadenylate cyclase